MMDLFNSCVLQLIFLLCDNWDLVSQTSVPVKGHLHVPERGITGLARWSNQVVVAAQWIGGVEQKVRWGISHVLRGGRVG